MIASSNMFQVLPEGNEKKGNYEMKNYDAVIIGAGPGGIFSAYELIKNKPELKIAVLEKG